MSRELQPLLVLNSNVFLTAETGRSTEYFYTVLQIAVRMICHCGQQSAGKMPVTATTKWTQSYTLMGRALWIIPQLRVSTTRWDAESVEHYCYKLLAWGLGLYKS